MNVLAYVDPATARVAGRIQHAQSGPLLSAAGRFAAAARDYGTCQRRLRGAAEATEAIWTGLAASGWGSQAGTVERRLACTAEAMGEIGQLIGHLAGAVRQAQAALRTAAGLTDPASLPAPGSTVAELAVIAAVAGACNDFLAVERQVATGLNNVAGWAPEPVSVPTQIAMPMGPPPVAPQIPPRPPLRPPGAPSDGPIAPAQQVKHGIPVRVLPDAPQPAASPSATHQPTASAARAPAPAPAPAPHVAQGHRPSAVGPGPAGVVHHAFAPSGAGVRTPQPPLVHREHGAAAASLLTMLRRWSRARRNPPAAHAATRRQPVGGVTFGGGKKVHMRPPHDR